MERLVGEEKVEEAAVNLAGKRETENEKREDASPPKSFPVCRFPFAAAPEAPC